MAANWLRNGVVTGNRFAPKPIGTVRHAFVASPHSSHTASMVAQAARVPRLANINATAHAIRAVGGGVAKKGARR
jgi:hypothetical protein